MYLFAPSMSCEGVSRGSQEQARDHQMGASAHDDAFPDPVRMPVLPRQYSVVLEINRVKSKETQSVKQYFDFVNQRVRTDVHDDGEMVSVIHDFNSKTKIILKNDLSEPSYDHEMNSKYQSSCTQEPLDLSSTDDFASKTLHLKDPHQVFMFDSKGDEQYVGLDYARGIKCTQWYADAEEDQVVDGHKLTIKSKRNHWFSAPDWSDANCVLNSKRGECATQYPVRVVSEGTVFNHTSGETVKFHDHYEYLDFVVGKPPHYLFDPTEVCTGVDASQLMDDLFEDAATVIGDDLFGADNGAGGAAGAAVAASGAAVAASAAGNTKKHLRESILDAQKNPQSKAKGEGGNTSVAANMGTSSVAVIVGVVVGVLLLLALVVVVTANHHRRRRRSFGGGTQLLHKQASNDRDRGLSGAVIQSGTLTAAARSMSSALHGKGDVIQPTPGPINIMHSDEAMPDLNEAII